MKIKRKINNQNIAFNIIEINTAGIMSKISSFENWLQESSPAIFTMQETKVTITGQIKSESTTKNQLYEQIRDINPGFGGGLCIGVNKDLPSTLLREGWEEVAQKLVNISEASIGLQWASILKY